MKKTFLIIVSCIFLCSSAFNQKRIGVDASTQLNNLNFTFHYQQVIKRNWLFGAGFFAGGNGDAMVLNDTMGLYNNTIRSPYSNVNQPYIDSNNVSYSILEYQARGKSIGLQAGFGYFHEFGVKHGIRANLYAKLGYASSKIYGYYRSTETFTEAFRRLYASHWVGAVSLELVHTIRFSKRYTFYYGAKVPFYFSIDKATFDPQSFQDLYAGVEPELTLGITRIIGQCD